jgi:ATP-binding cassette, subfamily B, bacterial PglK
MTILTRDDKQYLFGLLLFSIIIAIIETVGVSAIMPFISVATNFDLIATNEYYLRAYELFNISSDIEFIMIFGILLIFFYIFRAIVNVTYIYFLTKFTQGRYHFLAFRLFERYMGLPYNKFVKKNTSNLTKTIINEANHLTSLVSAILFIISEIFVTIFIYALMLYMNWQVTLIITLILSLSAILMIKIISPKIKNAGEVREELQRIFYEILNRSFGNFKSIKLKSNNCDMLPYFKDTSLLYSRANIKNSTLQQIPKFFFELMGFSIIVAIIMYLVYLLNGDASSSLALISMFVLSLYRLMPSINKIIINYYNILFYYKSFEIVYSDLTTYDFEVLGNNNISFKSNIIIKNLTFEYEVDKPILNDINIKIPKGSSIAFVGESGSGKSTLVDIIIGLYRPKNGILQIDNIVLNDTNLKAWRNKVGYIPQSVYLFDGTVGENVAFGLEYNQLKIDKVLKQSKIFNFLSTKSGSSTKVGEGGVMLSGGQKQRIAIARALYGDPEILVLDEATSALDDNTEKQIMNEIYDISGNKTLIIIAHRLSTLNKCDEIYEIKNGILNKILKS